MHKIILSLIILLFCVNGYCAVTFDGVDDLFTCGTADILPESGAVTISAWVYHSAAASDTIIGKRSSSTAGIGLSLQSTNELRYRIEGSTDMDRISTDTISASTWTHIAVTHDGSSTAANCELYINGTEVSAYTTTTNGVSPGDNATDTISIGSNAVAGSFFGGAISEVAVWNVELSASEISLLASSRTRRLPLNIQPSSLQAYWPIDECAEGVSCDGDTFYDYKSTNNCTGDDGAANDNLTGLSDVTLSYP